MEIGPASAGLAAERAIAFVDKVGRLFDFDADIATKAGQRQHRRFLT